MWLRKHKCVDRCVVLKGNRHVVLERVERYPPKRYADVFGIFSGDEGPKLVLEEVREFLVQD